MNVMISPHCVIISFRSLSQQTCMLVTIAGMRELERTRSDGSVVALTECSQLGAGG